MTFLHRPLLILALALPPLGAQPTRLELGKTVQAELGAGQTHQYTLTMGAGQFARIIVSLPRVATVMRISKSSQTQAPLALHWPGVAQSPAPLCLIARSTGEFRVELTAPLQLTSEKYSVTLETLKELPIVQKQAPRFVNGTVVFFDDKTFPSSLQGYDYDLSPSDTSPQSLQACNDFPKNAFEALMAGLGIKDRLMQANLLHEFVTATARYFVMGLRSQSESIDTFLEEELSIRREIMDRRGEGNVMETFGNLSYGKNKFEDAINYYGQALTIARELKHRASESRIMDSLGTAYRGLGKYQQSSDIYEQALEIRQGAGDRRGTGVTLIDLATVNSILGRYSKATSYLEQALAISRELKDPVGEVSSIVDMAGLYFDLGENHRSISYSEQALTMAIALKRRDLEARALSSLGSAFLNLGQPARAVHYFDRTFSAYQNTNNHLGRSMSVINLGEANLSLGNGEKAAQYCEDALIYARDIANRSRESMALACLGKIHTYLNHYDTAIDYYGKSLAIAREPQMRKLQADDLARLMLVWKSSDKPRLSIFYGKNAINVIQSIRSDNRSLSGELQQSFLKSNEKTYHALAELLNCREPGQFSGKSRTIYRDGDFLDPQDTNLTVSYADPAPTLTDPLNAAPAGLVLGGAATAEGAAIAGPIAAFP